MHSTGIPEQEFKNTKKDTEYLWWAVAGNHTMCETLSGFWASCSSLRMA
jgi:hypothetical protein